MTTLLELSAQITKVIEIFNRRPKLYEREGIARVSPAHREIDEFAPLLKHRKTDELLTLETAQSTSFAFLLMGALKKGLKEAVICEVSSELITALTRELSVAPDNEQINTFLSFIEQLAASENINDILSAQIIHDFLHIAVNIQSCSELNKMDAENCGRMFGVNLANFLRIDPSLGLILNGVVRELITGPKFSKPFLFDDRMRMCFERRQVHLSKMTAEILSQVNLQSSTILDASDGLMSKQSCEEPLDKKTKKAKKQQRRHSEAEVKVISSFEQITRLKSVITTLTFEQKALDALLNDGELTIPPLVSPRSPRVTPSPRELIQAGPGANLQRAQPLEIISSRENFKHRNRSTSYSPRSTLPSGPGLSLLHLLHSVPSAPSVLISTQEADQTPSQFTPPVFRNTNS
ncbi:MAG: hypothetical protein U1E78_06570 [Gammaproteobacteria bacterium]